MPNGWLQVAQEAIKIPGLLVQFYGDLAKPGVQQVGKALGTVFGLGNTVLWPIQWANERSRIALERNLENYRIRLESVPIEKIIPVAPEIGVPIAEKLSYVSDTKLSELYINLLTKASNSEFVWEAHPSFVNIITNLSPDEAHLLEYFVQRKNLEFVNAKWSAPEVYSFAGELLIDQVHAASLAFPGNIQAYFSNLAGLGLVSIHLDRSVHGSNVYTALEEFWTTYFNSKTPPAPDRTLEFERGAICVTTFGRQFIHACHQK